MSIHTELPAHELLAVAIRSEIEAADVYTRLQKRVKNEILKMKLKFLIAEEKKHRQILEKLFSQRFSERELLIPEKSFLPSLKDSLKDKFSVKDLFKFAQKAEKVSEKFYKEGGEKAEDVESRRILAYLARVERSHYFMIQSEIEMLDRFPDYYNVEDFHLVQDMFHLGP